MKDRLTHPHPEDQIGHQPEARRRRLSRPRTALAALALTAVAAAGAFGVAGGGESSEAERQGANTEQNHELDPVRDRAREITTEFASKIMELGDNTHARDSNYYTVDIPAEGGIYSFDVGFRGQTSEFNPEDATEVIIYVDAYDGQAEGGTVPVFRLGLGQDESGREFNMGATAMNEDGVPQGDVFTTGDLNDSNADFALTGEYLEDYTNDARTVINMAAQPTPESVSEIVEVVTGRT